jgi:hypothetical protein
LYYRVFHGPALGKGLKSETEEDSPQSDSRHQTKNRARKIQIILDPNTPPRSQANFIALRDGFRAANRVAHAEEKRQSEWHTPKTAKALVDWQGVTAIDRLDLVDHYT